MTGKLDRVCDQLRIKLHGIDRRLEALKGNAMALSEKSQGFVESQLVASSSASTTAGSASMRRTPGSRPGSPFTP